MPVWTMARRDNCPVAFTLAGRVNYDVAGL
jgi:hypothetical protein